MDDGSGTAEEQDPATQVSRLLEATASGDPNAAGKLARVVYGELRQLAHARIRRGQGTMRTTDLVHESWLRLMQGPEWDWDSKAHFFGAVANAMRNVLVDQARRRFAHKRAVDRVAEIDSELPDIIAHPPIEDVLSLHEALSVFETQHPRPAHVVTLRFFAGCSMPDVARLVGRSLATVEREWKFARSWLQTRMAGADGSP